MQVRRWDPFTVLARMDEQLDRALSREFDALVQRTWGTPGTGFVPPVEVVREADDVVVRVELPGIDPERDVSIEVERGKLVISGERREPAVEQEQPEGDPGRRVLLREWRYGAFRREFALPQGISPEQVEATYDAGLLDVRVKAVVPERRAVRVPVSVGARPAQAVESGSVVEGSVDRGSLGSGAERSQEQEGQGRARALGDGREPAATAEATA